jgi:tetratricopeptide (TPR) repeat protein
LTLNQGSDVGALSADPFLEACSLLARAKRAPADARPDMYRRAEVLLSAALQATPRKAKVHAAAGALYALRQTWHPDGKGGRAAAFEHFNVALEEDPHSGRVHAAVGKLHAASGDLQAATAAYKRALALDPTLAQARAEWSSVNLRLAARERAAEAHRSLASSLAETGDLAGAIASYNRALEGRLDDAETTAARDGCAGRLAEQEQAAMEATPIPVGEQGQPRNRGRGRYWTESLRFPEHHKRETVAAADAERLGWVKWGESK